MQKYSLYLANLLFALWQGCFRIVPCVQSMVDLEKWQRSIFNVRLLLFHMFSVHVKLCHWLFFFTERHVLSSSGLLNSTESMAAQICVRRGCLWIFQMVICEVTSFLPLLQLKHLANWESALVYIFRQNTIVKKNCCYSTFGESDL